MATTGTVMPAPRGHLTSALTNISPLSLRALLSITARTLTVRVTGSRKSEIETTFAENSSFG